MCMQLCNLKSCLVSLSNVYYIRQTKYVTTYKNHNEHICHVYSGVITRTKIDNDLYSHIDSFTVHPGCTQCTKVSRALTWCCTPLGLTRTITRMLA